MVDRATKDALNMRLHNEVLNRRAGRQLDYTASKTAMQPVLDELVKEGWVIPESWDRASKIEFQRKTTITVTRSPARQARLIELGVAQDGIAPDDTGTYQKTVSTTFGMPLNFAWKRVEGEPRVILNEQPVMLAVLALSAKRHKRRALTEQER